MITQQISKAKEKKYQQTKQSLRDALNRLIKGEPTVAKLKDKLREGTLKINLSSVEKEASKGSGTLRNHGDVKDDIEKAEYARINGKPNIASDSADDTRDEIERLNEKLKDVKGKLKTERRLKNENTDEVHRLQKAFHNQLDEHHSLTQALFEAIDVVKRQEMMEKLLQNRKRKLNVVQFSTGKV